MTTTYHADGFRPIYQSADPFGDVQNASDAACIFANRLAKRQYGKRGYARIVRPDSWSADGLSHVFETFIGKDSRYGGGCVGHNEWIYVSVRHPLK